MAGVHRRVHQRKVLTAGRLLLGLLTAALVGLAVPTQALADDDPIVVTGDFSGSVDTTVTDPGRPARVAAGGSRRQTAKAACRYFKTYYEASVPGGRTIDLGSRGTDPRRPGQWWLRVCSDWSRDLVFVPDGADPNGAVPAATPGELAARAYNRLRLPAPVARFNPARMTSVGPATTVHIPTWWWVRDWSVRGQRTAAGAVWAVVTARPIRSVWNPGDGGPVVTCGGRGRAWTPQGSRTSACSSVYASSSAAEPGKVYRASVTVVWEVTWVGSGGAQGTLPQLTMTTSFPVAVLERESVVLGGGGGR
jgi:hypothetical protein